MVENSFDAKPKVLGSNNGGEYTSNVFLAHLGPNGIESLTFCAYTPKQNIVVERKNRHLLML